MAPLVSLGGTRPGEPEEELRSVQQTEIELSADEWRSVVKRLGAYASTLVSVDVVQGLGIGAGDLVGETLRRLWDPASSVKWRADAGPPTVPAVAGFLKVVLKNYFLDCLRRGAYTHTAPNPAPDDDPDPGQPGGLAVPDASRESDHQVERILVDQLSSRARAIAEAEDDVEVALYIDLQVRDGGPYSNAEAAAELGVTAPDIVNIRKRLGRFVARVKRGEGAGVAPPRG